MSRGEFQLRMGLTRIPRGAHVEIPVRRSGPDRQNRRHRDKEPRRALRRSRPGHYTCRRTNRGPARARGVLGLAGCGLPGAAHCGGRYRGSTCRPVTAAGAAGRSASHATGASGAHSAPPSTSYAGGSVPRRRRLRVERSIKKSIFGNCAFEDAEKLLDVIRHCLGGLVSLIGVFRQGKVDDVLELVDLLSIR